MAEETRKVTAELEFQKTGDEKAFQEAAADVRALDAAADQSQGGLDDLAEKEKEAADGARELATQTRAAGGAAAASAPQLEDVGEAGEKAGEGMKRAGEGALDMKERLAIALPAIGGVLQAARALEDGLNEMFDALGRGDQDVKVKLNGLTGFIESMRMLPDLFSRAKAGIEAFQNAPGDLVDKLTAADEAVRGFDSSTEKLRDQIRGINEEISQEATNWENAVASLERAGEVHDSEIQRILDGLEKVSEKAEKAGVDLPASFDKMLAKYREMSGASQQRAQEATTEGAAVAQGAARQEEAHQGAAAAAGAHAGKVKELSAAEQQAATTGQSVKVVWNEQTKSLETVATAAGDAGAKIKEGAAKAGEGASDLQQAGQAGAEAGQGLETAATGAASLGKAAIEGKTGVQALKEALTDASGFSAFVDGLKQVVELAKSLDAMKLTGLRAELQAAKADADALAQSLRAADAEAA